ncbi:MAG: hypothetical protein IKD79_03315 [Oscillospiraceae bacterium]|nr:hypothetical protein [Oscillospiraceae bacterium]
MPIRRILRRAGRMCPAAYRIQKLSVLWACILLTGALLMLEGALPLSPATYGDFRLALSLADTASAVLLVGVVGAVIVEERQL